MSKLSVHSVGAWLLTALCALIMLPATLLSDAAPGRVSYVEGTAAVAQEGDADWLEITVNTPVRRADRYVLQSDGLMELELDGNIFVRFGPDTDATLEEYGPAGIRLLLTSGDLIFRLRDSVPVSIATETARIELKERGLYRVSRNGKWVKLVVRKGKADVATQNHAKIVESGDVVEIRGPEDRLASVSLIDIRDDFDFWSDRRDAGTVSAESARFMGSSYAGSYDLDRYGTWDYESDYGWVWWPTVAVGWSPYVSGRWIFYPSWGWTWVSYEPWGWLPYHHGRWIHSAHASRWCWVPGHFNAWSPALVDFHYSNGHVCWSPIPFGQDGPSRTRFVDRLRSGNHPGLTVVPESQFVSSSRYRSERNRPVRELALPGSDDRRVRPEYLGRKSMVDSIWRGGANGTAPGTTGVPTRAIGPRIVTIPDASSASSGNGLYPDRSRIDRAPLEARGPIRGASPSSTFGHRSGSRPSYGSGWYGSRSGSGGVQGSPSPGRSAPQGVPSWAPGRGTPGDSSPQMRSGAPVRGEGPSRSYDRPSVGGSRPAPSAPSRGAPNSGPSRSAPATRGDRQR